MIKFGKMTHPGMEIIKEINKSKKLGFDYVEIGIEIPTDASVIKNKASLIKNSLKKFSYPPIGHTAWWYDLSSPYNPVRVGWIKQAEVDINAASIIGIKILNFHFLVLSSLILKNKKYRNIILDNYIKSLRYLSRFAKRKNITLMLENGDEKFEDYRYVLDRVPEIRVHFDVGHANIHGGIKKIRKFLAYFNDRIIHIHIHDNHGKSDDHLPLGKGTVNWKKVVSFLKKINYSKTLTFEVYTSLKDLTKSKKYFEKLWSIK